MIIENKVTPKETAELLLNEDNILLLCHKNPDGDTVGSAGGLLYALKKLGKNAAVLCSDAIPAKYDFLNIELFNGQFEPKFVVAVDVASANLFGDGVLPYSENVDLCIDHHPSNSGYAKMVCCDGTLPATAQLMLDIINIMEVPLDKNMANCLYTGIMTDTGCFKYAATTDKTHLAAAQLLQAGAEHLFISNRFFMSRSRKNIELEKYALNNMEFLYGDKCALVMLTKDILEEIQAEPSDIEGISAMPRSIEGVEIGITIRQINDDTFKISVRTGETIDASRVAQGLGGGGHTRAAGCEVMGSAQCARKAILREVEQALCQ